MFVQDEFGGLNTDRACFFRLSTATLALNFHPYRQRHFTVTPLVRASRQEFRLLTKWSAIPERLHATRTKLPNRSCFFACDFDSMVGGRGDRRDFLRYLPATNPMVPSARNSAGYTFISRADSLSSPHFSVAISCTAARARTAGQRTFEHLDS